MTSRSWHIEVSDEAEKALRRAPANLRRRLARAVDRLATDPRPHGCRKLEGHDLWRVRVGGWRIVYAIEDQQLLVLVVEVAPRGGVYRDL